MVEQACSLYPQIRDHIDYVDIGTPVTNAYYIAAPHGEIYGLDHTKTRMSPEVKLRRNQKYCLCNYIQYYF